VDFKNILTVHRFFEIPNFKHQIPNKSQIPNTNDPVLMKISFSIRLTSFKIIRFGILNFGHCDFFVIWNFH